MKAFHAAISANRISDCAILVGGVLSGVLVFTVALPLALSSPYPTLKQGDWIIEPATYAPASAAAPATAATYELASLHPAPDRAPSAGETNSPAEPKSSMATTSSVAMSPVEATASVVRMSPVATTAPAERASPVVRISFADRWSLAMAVPEVASSVALPPEAARLETPEQRLAPAPPRRRDVSTMEEVDRYLWEVYQRQPVKWDSSGDFSWKDPAAAKHRGMSMQDYAIRGMDADFREQLYHAGHAMDGNGINWSMLSAFRDDYRQGLASGYKAHGGNSKHGGSKATGGYGHGQAIDITSADGDDSAVWHSLDAHGAKYGLHRPNSVGSRARPAEQQVARDRGRLAQCPCQARRSGGHRRQDPGCQGIAIRPSRALSRIRLPQIVLHLRHYPGGSSHFDTMKISSPTRPPTSVPLMRMYCRSLPTCSSRRLTRVVESQASTTLVTKAPISARRGEIVRRTR